MRSSLANLLALAILPVLTTACTTPGAAPLSDADTAAVRSASREYTQAVKDTAWARWATLFTEDAAFLPPHTPIRRGRAAIEAWVRTFPPLRDLRIEPTEVIGRGDLAFTSGRYSLTVIVAGMPPAPDSGKYIEVWRKQPDGSWKLFRDIFNSDLPVPAPTASTGQPTRH